MLLAISGAWYLVRREEGMGLGDVKMLALIGAFLGWKGTLVALFFASFAGALIGLALLACGGAGMRTKLPFGASSRSAASSPCSPAARSSTWYAGLL